jgi:hypothetical protein
MTEARMAREERAHQYQRVQTARNTLLASITRLASEAPVFDATVAALNSILVLVGDVDPHLVTKPSALVPGGASAQELLQRTATQALELVAQKREKTTAALASARAALLPVEVEYQTFE